MVKIDFIAPKDQPTGRRRLLGELKEALLDKRFSRFWFVVAYAKSGPLLRLEPLIEQRRKEGLNIHAIFGVDQMGTTAQALAFALKHFDAAYITREAGPTFHPKMFVFAGKTAARGFIGSHNLTVGGTETNFEASLRVDFELPADKKDFAKLSTCWDELLPGPCPATRLLTNKLLAELIEEGTVPDEQVLLRTSTGRTGGPRRERSGLDLKPPSALPPKKKAQPAPATKAAPAKVATQGETAPEQVVERAGVKGFAIQIKPHDNGEIFLSVTAALQNPDFFKWPFKGQTTPKKGTNTSYPQLSPDPVVNITVYGAGQAAIKSLSAFELNTVYYERNSEIRITASPLVGIVPDYSVMVMQQSEQAGIDYEIVVHTPASSEYAAWEAACNQQMPGGGKQPRKFGWF
ncbi:phospholipase D family protein [Bradyrhizobium japonicum]|uniref:phospholipase D family protein n=1 Tax=Bradyrhizobium japonicum TaxID=375 RepID=UPI0027145F66|nr:phospholipase D family protein [Bradyrhizobium japonicum]WLB57456.1 phospholipase D family protein [Bradyrhizobium japonicum]